MDEPPSPGLGGQCQVQSGAAPARGNEVDPDDGPVNQLGRKMTQKSKIIEARVQGEVNQDHRAGERIARPACGRTTKRPGAGHPAGARRRARPRRRWRSTGRNTSPPPVPGSSRSRPGCRSPPAFRPPRCGCTTPSTRWSGPKSGVISKWINAAASRHPNGRRNRAQGQSPGPRGVRPPEDGQADKRRASGR